MASLPTVLDQPPCIVVCLDLQPSAASTLARVVARLAWMTTSTTTLQMIILTSCRATCITLERGFAAELGVVALTNSL